MKHLHNPLEINNLLSQRVNDGNMRKAPWKDFYLQIMVNPRWPFLSCSLSCYFFLLLLFSKTFYRFTEISRMKAKGGSTNIVGEQKWFLEKFHVLKKVLNKCNSCCAICKQIRKVTFKVWYSLIFMINYWALIVSWCKWLRFMSSSFFRCHFTKSTHI